MIAHVESAVFGPAHKSYLIETLSFGSSVLRFRKDKTCTSWVCANPKAAQEYSDSELCGFTFTDDGYLALFELMKRAYDVKHWHCTRPKMPVLFVSGSDDPCMINVRHFAKAVQDMRRAGYRRRERQAVSGNAPRNSERDRPEEGLSRHCLLYKKEGLLRKDVHFMTLMIALQSVGCPQILWDSQITRMCQMERNAI